MVALTRHPIEDISYSDFSPNATTEFELIRFQLQQVEE